MSRSTNKLICNQHIQHRAMVRCRFPLQGRFIYLPYLLVEYHPALGAGSCMQACAFAVVRFRTDLVDVPHFDIHPHDYEALQQGCGHLCGSGLQVHGYRGWSQVRRTSGSRRFYVGRTYRSTHGISTP